MYPIRAIDGLPVIDAKKALTLIVTKTDIAKADPKKPDNCAIACAAKRAFHVLEARVHLSRIYLRTNQNNWVRYVVPQFVRAEIIAFDRGGSFEPLEFTLYKPTGSDKLGSSHRGGSHTKKNPKRTYHITKNVRTGPA